MNEKLKHLDLFSGIGGFALGLESTGGFETVGFCDNEPFAQKVLKKHWPDVPCYEDVRDVGVDTVGLDRIDIITGGFPCQPFSVAGKQDPNDNRQLWPEMFRIIKEIRPTYVIGENVRNLISIREGVVFEQVCTDLEGEGYEVQTFVLSASSQNAPHLRYRCWIVGIMADTESQRSFSTSKREKRKQEQSGLLNNKKEVRSKVRSKSARCSELREQDVANSKSKRQQPLKNRTKIIQSSERQEILCRSGDAARTRQKDVSNSISQRGRSRKSRGKDAEDARKLSRSEEHRQGNIIGRMGGTTDGLSKGLDRHWGDGWEEGTPRVAEGQKNRANRLKGLGNAVVPQIPAVLGKAIMEVHNG